MRKTKQSVISLVVSAALLAGTLAAEPQTITIKDWTGRGFAPDLVNYTIDAPADSGKSLRLLDADGKSLPVQLTPGENGPATLSFVAAIPPGGTAVYTIRTDGQGSAAPPAVSATRDGDALVLANQRLAVKVPAPMTKTFEKPVAADTLPAPLLAFRGPDGPSTGLGTGAWRGAGTLLLKRPVKKFTVTQSANGPVFTEVRYRLDYAEGGWYEATVRVTDRAPFAQVREAYDLGVNADTDFWELDLSKGWEPDAAEHMSVAGQGFYPLQYPSLEKEEKTVASGPSVGANFQGGGDGPVRSIHHDSCWGQRFVSYYGIHNAEARQAAPDNYPLATVAPLHKGDWRRSASLPVYVKGGVVRVRFPMSVTPTSWLNEPRSDVSPFSCHEHDPSLPTTYGRRVWGLVLARPALLVKGEEGKIPEAIGYSVRNLYGMVGLDRYKDFILEWPFGSAQGKPGPEVTYPRVFTTPEWQAEPAGPVAPDFRVVSHGRNLPASIQYIMTSLSIPHHHTLGDYGGPVGNAEAALANPDLPEATRRQLRGQLALLCYLLVEPDVTSAGDGSHHGNPNMGVSRLMDRSNLAALIPDHPMHRAWADYMGMFMAYKMGSFMAPEGAWFEYGASYHMHGYGKILRGMMGAFSSGVPEADQIYAYNRADLDYFLNLLSPVDPRYGSRTIPGTANSPVGQSPHYIQSMGTVADRDPEFAANLRWAWNQNGRMIGTGGDAITIPAMIRPSIPAKEPKLTSRVYPGFGVIFRGHQGPDETCLYLRSGYHWSHWSQDQGNLMLYAKGAVLLPPQPYQYGGPKDKSFPDKNFIRFGAPVNDLPHDWADSNILDATFGPTVDYAWSSTGYPEWFINPGRKPGWGKPRELVDGLKQTEGAFTWDRQVAFLKGKTGKSPNYFVIRDSMNGDPSADSTGSPQAGSGQGGKLASWFSLSLLGRKQNVKVEGAKVAVDTEWPTKLDLVFTGREDPAFEMVEDDLVLAFGGYNKFSGDLVEDRIPTRDWVGADGAAVPVRDILRSFLRVKERHVALRMQSAPGQEVAWVLYPRGAGEAAPTATQLAPGVTKVVTAESTDYVFLSTTPLTYTGEGVEFTGLAGAVRVAGDGKATLALSAGPGKAGYSGTVIESAAPFEKTVAPDAESETLAARAASIQAPAALAGAQPVAEGVTKATADGVTQYVAHASAAIAAVDGNVHLHARNATVEIGADAIRFVVPERAYAQLSVGNVGVRGVGPFDLTFTADAIAGKVDGGIRTIVTTWPEDITRPGYAMDGVRWYAGFSDEHSIIKGTKAPQFGIALGVSAGPHEVRIGEWVWPAMPPSPPRAVLAAE